jgi:DNA-binding transcriptional LysR family regulator
LARSQRLMVASPGYLARHGRPLSLDDLGGHRAIYYMNRGVADWRFSGGDAGFPRPVAALRVNNGDVMRDAAVAGLGMALLPSFIVGAEIRSGALVVVDVGTNVAPESIYVAHPEGRRASAKLRALVASVRKAFGDPPYWEVDVQQPDRRARSHPPPV